MILLVTSNQKQILMLPDKNQWLYHTFHEYYIYNDNILTQKDLQK